MERTMDEQKVLDKLGIDDFRHLTKQKAIQLVSMLDRVDPAVAIEALKQFPELAKLMSGSLKEYSEAAKKALDSNDKSQQKAIDSIDKLTDTLAKELEKENLSDEERERIIEHMMTLVKMASEKDSENKEFLFNMAKLGALTLLAAGAIAVNALGGNVNVADIAQGAKNAAKSLKA